MKRLKITMWILSANYLVSCANITPIVNERETIPYSGNDQNGGIIQDFEDYSSEITPEARNRYNDLILSQEGIIDYLKKKDFGITGMANGNFNITAEGKEYWYELKLNARDVTK